MRRNEAIAAGAGLLAATLPLRASAQSAAPAPAALRVGALAIESAAEGYYAQQSGAFRRYGIAADVQILLAVNRLLQSNALSMALPGANLKRAEFMTAAEGYRFYAQR